jgi:hypothetical protein
MVYVQVAAAFPLALQNTSPLNSPLTASLPPHVISIELRKKSYAKESLGLLLTQLIQQPISLALHLSTNSDRPVTLDMHP